MMIQIINLSGNIVKSFTLLTEINYRHNKYLNDSIEMNFFCIFLNYTVEIIPE